MSSDNIEKYKNCFVESLEIEKNAVTRELISNYTTLKKIYGHNNIMSDSVCNLTKEIKYE